MKIPFLIAFAFVVFPTLLPAADDPLELGPFGIGSCHVRGRNAGDSKTWIPQMREIGLRYLRSGGTGWSMVQPEKERFDFKELDEQLDYFSQQGILTGGLLLGNPGWNTADAPGSLPVNNLAGWSEYVSEIVKHTRGRVKWWEVWNEPPNFTGRDQTPADYAKIVISAYDAAKAADPACRVGLAAKSSHVQYLEAVIEAGAKDHFDYITLHPYEILDGIADDAGTEAVFMNIVPVVRKMLAAKNPAKKDVPILFTELGCDAEKKGADVQANVLVKAYAMGIAQGVSCIHWFEGMDGDSGPMGLIDASGKPRPSYTALAQMIRHLGQKPGYLGWVLMNGKNPAFAFQGAAGPVLVAWTSRKTRDEIRFSKPVGFVNPRTGQETRADKLTLTSAPVLVLGVPEDLLKQAASNKNKPLPWGGDYREEKSVSVTIGERQVEKGLHTFAGDSVAQAVVAYGGPARSGNVPGGNVFVVDPGFLSYTATPVPIEITAVVRRNEANDNAGFKLVYESTSGLKTAASGWYTVPDNEKWHTVKWQLDDARFVNYWGYNFALESDGPKYGGYYLQSVTVTKR
ncbi:beta-galactosidase [Luteolibacter yonseiensis]|uniref:Beta-galactosidase n=1 Tax=Luteolibacter yonseiensis TaxID=1144680 RepID=A0A934R2Y3_9BACT|nr:beta-galactosidase [Luteolibacter yonseiensis]MBK1815326.1 beta-galactosidase [Luteolibacter yonseiensis]